jgi:hypothetical protein
MTKARPQQTRQKTPRKARAIARSSAPGADIGDLLIAELRSRRLRLQELLERVWMEASSRPAKRAAARPASKCVTARS